MVGLVLAACTGQASPSPSASVLVVGPQASGAFVPIIVNQEFGVGENHVVFTLTDAANKVLSSPDRSASIALTSADGSATIPEQKAEFVWGIVGSQGFYVTDVTFPSAGDWKATISSAEGETAPASATLTFTVKDKTSAIAIGQRAPSTKTPTAADVKGNLKAVSTDPSPDPRFYQLSEDQALIQHKPFVLIFATPAFCQSRECGPALDHVKTLASQFPTMTFINVEPYQMTFTDGRLQPVNGQLTSNDVTNAWGILTEPWVYVVDKDGIVRGSFPSVFSDAELTQAIKAVE